MKSAIRSKENFELEICDAFRAMTTDTKAQTYAEIKALIIHKAELAFEQETKGCIHFLICPDITYKFNTEGVDASCKVMDDIREWLKENLEEGSYVAFPEDAMGKYGKYGNAVGFRNANDAMRFKLVWC